MWLVTSFPESRAIRPQPKRTPKVFFMATPLKKNNVLTRPLQRLELEYTTTASQPENEIDQNRESGSRDVNDGDDDGDHFYWSKKNFLVIELLWIFRILKALPNTRLHIMERCTQKMQHYDLLKEATNRKKFYLILKECKLPRPSMHVLHLNSAEIQRRDELIWDTILFYSAWFHPFSCSSMITEYNNRFMTPLLFNRNYIAFLLKTIF